MTSKQIKSEINEVLDKVSDTALKDILEYLKDISNMSQNQIDLSRNLRQILNEDSDLLKRLAQ